MRKLILLYTLFSFSTLGAEIGHGFFDCDLVENKLTYRIYKGIKNGSTFEVCLGEVKCKYNPDKLNSKIKTVRKELTKVVRTRIACKPKGSSCPDSFLKCKNEITEYPFNLEKTTVETGFPEEKDNKSKSK